MFYKKLYKFVSFLISFYIHRKICEYRNRKRKTFNVIYTYRLYDNLDKVEIVAHELNNHHIINGLYVNEGIVIKYRIK